ncbi:C-terminal novel E3 ligase, LRR-interacting [Pseudomonas sp. NFR09]|uniref:NEL-type E3 ubiquitin ligase domain-containing protein n=1 Tax=Pseudomonas sp. NFR09 TaxID=1566249 RepID=UPI0008B07F96|nr:NEL-type E3 ubiquitin ligase domain-containing protein [Pseudomonas sp. NFR09]SES75312.1 C-terminal novel E3 ligase, LRR-interacting [Pseudomonas sp. NFR09]
MPTHQLLNGLSGNLQSSDAWGRQQALEQIRETLTRTLNTLSPDQQRDYVRLQRNALQALKAVETENNALIGTFKTWGQAQLRARIGNQDPKRVFLHTRYLEQVQPPMPWEPRTSSTSLSRERRRFRRAYDEWKYRSHVSTLSLWDAACLNFDFTTGTPQRQGSTFVDASYFTGNENPVLTVQGFVEIARELDLGGQLQRTLDAALGRDGRLQQLLQDSARACLLFEALEAYRNRAVTGVTLELYHRLTQAIDGSGAALEFETLGMSTGITLLPAVPFVPSGETIPVPLLLIRVGSLGVVSYFPFRPGGALHYHIDSNAAHAHFMQQLKDSHRQHDLGWFARQLPVTEMTAFKRLDQQERRPEHLSALAGFLYDTFHRLFPAKTLDSLRFSPDPKHGRPETLVQALTYRHVQHYQANLSTLATSRSTRDLQAVMDGAAAIADEILQLLLTPMPGGVTGLNRVMQAAVFGSLTYSTIVGINEAAKGQAMDFAAALADVMDLAINGLLITTAGRVHRLRIQGLLQRLGNPQKLMRNDETGVLWKPDIGPYAILDQNLLNGQTPNAQGVYQINGQQYAWLNYGKERRVVEISHDAKTLRFVLKQENRGDAAPPIVFDPALQAWTLDLRNAHDLSDVQLIERMLPNGSSPVPRLDLERMLRSISPSRATLDNVWAGEPAPVNLTEGVRRLQVDRVIDQLISDFHRRGHLPPHADGAVLCLLPHVPGWPADASLQVHDAQGTLIETYAAADTPPATGAVIKLKRRDDGTYIALDGPDTTVVSQEPLFELILEQQPSGSVLGKEGSPHLTTAQRIARVRLQISELAQARRLALFSALYRYAGHARHEVPASDPARLFTPLKVAPPLVEVTPVLKTLRERFAPLTPANLAQLLNDMPLSEPEQARLLQTGKLPQALHEHLEHHRTALRIDVVIDGLYHRRAFNPDTDQWAREFAASLLRDTLGRHFVVTDMSSGDPGQRYESSGPDDTTVELLFYGEGRYEAYDMRNGGAIPVSPAVDSFYLAIGSVLQPHERLKLGMQSASDAQGLRTTLGDLMSAQRSPSGYVSLLDLSLHQYEQNVVLPAHLQAGANGLYDLDGQTLLPLYGSLYPVVYDNSLRKWRLKHPEKIGVDTPTLEHNRRGAWRLSTENPMTWSDHRLLYRLGAQDYNVDETTAARILKITDTPARALRESHSTQLPPPPLLEDTCKRFRIERDILHFIQAMTTYSAQQNARPSLQLQLASHLPTWPDSHSLEVVDDNGRVISQYRYHPTTEKIRLTEAESRSREPLKKLVQNDALTRALLGELPATQEERLFKLAKAIAEYAYRERAQLFDNLYAQSEQGGNRLEQRLKSSFPQLPRSAVRAILDQATPRELKQLQDHGRVGLRLVEQARLTADDMRLNRAYEGLYLRTLANPDSERITLHLLKELPGWPRQLRLDIHDGNARGRLLESAGHLAGIDRRTLARFNGGFHAYDKQGRLLNDPADVGSDLLSAIALLLSETECRALGIADSVDLSPLRQAIAELALNRRIAIKGLLGLRHIPPWLQPPMQVDSSFIAYPFSLRGLWPFGGDQPVDLLSKVRELYPSFSQFRAQELIDSLGMSEPAALIELQRRKAEYQGLQFELQRWIGPPQAVDAPRTDPVARNYGVRRQLADSILRAWRQETRVAYISGTGLFDAHQLVLRLDGNSLPDADFILNNRGFEHIEYLRIDGDAFPETGNAFLGKFTGLTHLKIDCMLNELPASLTQMTQLENLDLSDNTIVLTAESRQRLAGMTRLAELHLDGNPLGLTPDISRMTRLRVLSLRQTNIDQWPIGAETRSSLRTLLLQENRLTTVPDAVFSDVRMGPTNRNTILHDNPLSETTLARIRDYRRRTGIVIGGALPGTLHQQAMSREFSRWLAGVPVAQHSERQQLWEQLQHHEGARSDDAFRVLRDLIQSYAYTHSPASQQTLTTRVWHLLEAMGQSTELREQIFLNTYVAGTCGDGAILAFIDMEIQHKVHQARSQAGSSQADHDLLSLARGLFYLRKVDELADTHLQKLREEEIDPDDAEVKLYYRLRFRDEYNLPILREEMLYSVEDWVDEQDIVEARDSLAGLERTQAVQNSVLMEEFWIEYLARSYPEPFSTIENVVSHQLKSLNLEISNRRSEAYLERRQSLMELEIAERNRLVRQLTEAAQLAQQQVN